VSNLAQPLLDLPDDDAPVAARRGPIRAAPLLALHLQAGRSILTVRSRKTGARFTFRFSRPAEEPGRARPIWVSVLTGPDNDSHYEFLGTMWPTPGRSWGYRHSTKSRIADLAPSVKAANWIFRWLALDSKVLLEEAEWWHEGRCGRCGRTLTVPESIETGFGPDCAAFLGL
jgi:hypothetical protein